MKKNYIVHCKRGRVAVTVAQSIIDLRGERFAVAQATWQKLIGVNPLGELVDKNSPTRDFIMDELYSRPQYARGDVWDKFIESINFTVVSIDHGK